MYLIPFVQLFREQGEAETRVITTRNHDVLPDDEYALVEAYCPDPQCDCRRVMLSVLPRRQLAQGFLASISFGFDRDQELAGPFLDPVNPQSRYADRCWNWSGQFWPIQIIAPAWSGTIGKLSRPLPIQHIPSTGCWLDGRAMRRGSQGGGEAEKETRGGNDEFDNRRIKYDPGRRL